MASRIEVSAALCAALILFAALVFRARECLCTLGRTKLIGCSISSSLRRFFRVALLLEAEQPTDAIDAYALELLHREQRSCARSVCFLFAVLTSVYCIMFNAWLVEGGSDVILFSEAQHVVCCIAAAAFLVIRLVWSCKALTSSKLAEWIYVGACLSVNLLVIFSRGSRLDVRNTVALGLMLGFVAAFARMDTCLVTCWNVVYMCVSIVKHALTEAGTMKFGQSTLGFAVLLMCIVAAQTFAAHQLYTSTRESIWNTARVKESKIEQGASGKLLENACDVVVPVDASFSILDDAKRFSALLLHDVSRSLRGQNILDHIAKEEDKERLQKSLRRISSTLEPEISALKLHLRDSRGGEVSVDSMGVAYRDVDGTQKYLIGLRELSDFLPRPIRELRRETVAPAEVVRDGPNRTPATSALGTAANVISQPLPHHAHDIDAPNARSTSTRSCRRYGVQDLVSSTWHETSERAKIESLLMLIGSWNCKLLPGCCSVHRTIPEVKRMLQRISEGMCDHTYHRPQSQCPSCGMLGSCEEDLMCNVCHYDETIGL